MAMTVTMTMTVYESYGHVKDHNHHHENDRYIATYTTLCLSKRISSKWHGPKRLLRSPFAERVPAQLPP